MRCLNLVAKEATVSHPGSPEMPLAFRRSKREADSRDGDRTSGSSGDVHSLLLKMSETQKQDNKQILDEVSEIKAQNADIKCEVSGLKYEQKKLVGNFNELNKNVVAQGVRVAKVETLVAEHADVLSDVVARLNQLEAQKGDWDDKANALEKRVAHAESAPPKPIDTNFDRPADPTKVKIKCKVIIPNECIKKSIDSLAADCSFDEQCYTIVGKGKSFFAAFKGAPQACCYQS